MNNNNKIPSKGSTVLSVFFVISILFGFGFAGGAHYVYYSADTMTPEIIGFALGACFHLMFTMLVLLIASHTNNIEAASSDGIGQ